MSSKKHHEALYCLFAVNEQDELVLMGGPDDLRRFLGFCHILDSNGDFPHKCRYYLTDQAGYEFFFPPNAEVSPTMGFYEAKVWILDHLDELVSYEDAVTQFTDLS